MNRGFPRRKSNEFDMMKLNEIPVKYCGMSQIAAAAEEENEEEEGEEKEADTNSFVVPSIVDSAIMFKI